MKATVRKWGNSLAVRIPKAISEELCIEDKTEMEMVTREGLLILEPKHRYQLKEMLDGITDENLHGEIDTGRRTGVEEW